MTPKKATHIYTDPVEKKEYSGWLVGGTFTFENASLGCISGATPFSRETPEFEVQSLREKVEALESALRRAREAEDDDDDDDLQLLERDERLLSLERRVLKLERSTAKRPSPRLIQHPPPPRGILRGSSKKK